MRFRVFPLCRPHWFGALVRLRSIGTGQLLKAGGAVEEFTGGVQFRMEFRLVEVSGGVHPLIFCWGRWKNGWGACLPCWGVFRQFPAFEPLWFPWLPNILWMIWLALVALIALCFISSYPVGSGGFITSVAIERGSPRRNRLALSLFPAVYSARRRSSSNEEIYASILGHRIRWLLSEALALCCFDESSHFFRNSRSICSQRVGTLSCTGSKARSRSPSALVHPVTFSPLMSVIARATFLIGELNPGTSRFKRK